MSEWYYVQEDERKGPASFEIVKGLFDSKILTEEDLVWQVGMDNWTPIKDIANFYSIEDAHVDIVSSELEDGQDVIEENLESFNTEEEDYDSELLDDVIPAPISLMLGQLHQDHKKLFIRIGHDRGADTKDYGPFKLEMIQKLFDEKRINAKTYIFAQGMENWEPLGSFADFESIFGISAPLIGEQDRRKFPRRPFVARMFFSDRESVHEGICRDISETGLQVLLDYFPGEVGDEISLNVHPDNSSLCFTASGEVIRILKGRAGFSLEFKDISSSAIELIQDYISQK